MSQFTNNWNDLIIILFSHYRLSVVYCSPQSDIVKISSQINILEEVSITTPMYVYSSEILIFQALNESSNQCESLFLDLLSNCLLNQLITFPTRWLNMLEKNNGKCPDAWKSSIFTPIKRW